MAYIPRSSFAQSDATPMQIQKKRTFHIISFFGTLMLSCAILALVGTFLYEGYLQSQLSSLKVELNGLGQGDTDQKMLEVKAYDHKLNVAHTLLDNHIAISDLFDKIGASTKQTVRFKHLEYTYDPGFQVELKLKGDTKELESVALQKVQFIKDSMFSDFVVRDISFSLLGQSSTDLGSQSKQAQAPGTPQSQNNKTIADAGTAFEVAGFFEKETLAYTGEEKVQQSTQINALPVVGDSQDNLNTSPISNDENI